MKKMIFAALLAGATFSVVAQAPMKRVPRIEPQTVTVKTRPQHRAVEQTADDALFESFEDWNGSDSEWIPEGWTVEMRGTNQNRNKSWTPQAAVSTLPTPPDGNYCYAINYALVKQDEWLISPQVEVAENMELEFQVFLQPLFLFSVTNLNTSTYVYNGAKIVKATLQVWAQAEDDEWQQLYDIKDEYLDKQGYELVNESPTDFEPRRLSLDDFAGKKTRIAFRYVGTDGDMMMLDAIRIGYPVLEGVSYIEPESVLYWGLDRSGNSSLATIAQYPVYEPLTWENTSEVEADFSWEYADPENPDNTLTSDYGESLTVTFLPDYSTDVTKRNNFIAPPTLTGTTANHLPGTFTAPYLSIQAGGKAEITFNDGSELDNGSLLPFPWLDLGLKRTYCEDTVEGVMTIPVFGHDELGTVDDYWLKYSLNGNEKLDGDYSHLTGIANLFKPSNAPLVVNGITLYAYGQMDDEAELTATIYALNSSMSADKSTFTTVATATCKGSDVITDSPTMKGELVIPFDFDEPVVVRYTDEHPAYFFMIEGFRSEHVNFFAPMQSKTPDTRNWGFIMNEIDLSAHTGVPAYTSIKAIVYKSDINDPDSYVDPYSAFAIGLNAEYPWLTCDAEQVTLTDDEPQATVMLGSYYDGSQLTVTAPEGIDATVSGRYDECALTIRATGATSDGTVTVSGPGVEVSVSVAVEIEQTDIREVNSASDADAVIYDLQGRRVVTPRGGLYIENGKKVIR